MGFPFFAVRTLSLLDWIPALTACKWPCQASSAAINVNDLGVSSSYTQPTPWRQSIIRRSVAPNLAHSSTLYLGLGSSWLSTPVKSFWGIVPFHTKNFHLGAIYVSFKGFEAFVVPVVGRLA